jgi:plasmid stabilization system protein ParE
LVVRTHGSAQTTGWKDQIRDACIAARPTQTIGPVAVTVRFGVSARRNWTNLWKPAIDSLGPMLGEPVPGKRFEPSDDRIVRLDLHRVVRADLADDVLIEVWWQTGVPAAAESAP